jgi:serine/tyrosine/threonine adenylyltransferase
VTRGEDSDRALVEAAERLMSSERIPVDTFFHMHHGGRIDQTANISEAYATFKDALVSYLPTDNNLGEYWRDKNPCSMLIEEVELIWTAIAEQDDWEPLHRKITNIRRMAAAHTNTD